MLHNMFILLKECVWLREIKINVRHSQVSFMIISLKLSMQISKKYGNLVEVKSTVVQAVNIGSIITSDSIYREREEVWGCWNDALRIVQLPPVTYTNNCATKGNTQYIRLKLRVKNIRKAPKITPTHTATYIKPLPKGYLFENTVKKSFSSFRLPNIKQFTAFCRFFLLLYILYVN